MKVKGMVEVARALIASAKSRWVLERSNRQKVIKFLLVPK